MDFTFWTLNTIENIGTQTQIRKPLNNCRNLGGRSSEEKAGSWGEEWRERSRSRSRSRTGVRSWEKCLAKQCRLKGSLEVVIIKRTVSSEARKLTVEVKRHHLGMQFVILCNLCLICRRWLSFALAIRCCGCIREYISL